MNEPNPAPEPLRDASGAGVEPGGLRSGSEIKILICYLLKSVGRPVAKEAIPEILMRDGLANYFEIQNAVAELLKLGHIRISEREPDALEPAETGLRIADTLETELPYTVRTKAVSAAVRVLEKVRKERENQVLIDKAEDGGYIVTCRVMDGPRELLCVRLRVADKLQAATVREIFLEDPAVAYSGVLALFTGDINPVFESAYRLKNAKPKDD